MEGNMGKRIPRMLIFALAMVFVCAGTLRAQDDSPPGVEKGWNLISSPCDVSLDELHQKLGNDEILVFAWSGTEYVQVDAMERGRGYFLNDHAVLNSSVVCKNETPLPEGFAVTLQAGWNLIGNPYHRAITFEKGFAASADKMSDVIYAWQGNRLRALDKGDHMVPFQGYWVYANEPVSLTFLETDPGIGPGGINITCDPLAVNRVAPDAETVRVGDAVQFEALCTYDVQTVDVTAGAEWRVNAPDVLAPGDEPGSFTAIAAGDAIVTMEYEEIIASVSLTVEDALPPPATLVSIALQAGKTSLDAGQSVAITATGLYSDGTTKDVTAEAAFTSSDPAVGAVTNGAFHALAAGTANVTAAVGEITSEPLAFTVTNLYVTSLEIESSRDVIEIHETAMLVARATYNNGSVVTVTGKVAWQINPDTGAAIEASGRFNPLQLGTVNVVATLDGVRSNTLPVNVTPKSLRWLGIYTYYGVEQLPCPTNPRYSWCYTHGAIEVGGEGKFGVYGEYDTEDAKSLSPPFKWDVTDKSILTVDSQGTLNALSKGLAGIRVYRDGVYSEWLWIYVYDSGAAEFLLVEYSNEETIVEKGKSINIGVTHYIKSATSGFVSSNVTRTAQWHLSDASVGSLSEFLFTGAKAGDTDVSATYNGLTSNSVTLRVWEPSHLQYCDANNPNEMSWNDGLSVATLEADCHEYSGDDNVNVCFKAEISQVTDRRVLDVCLDLYIYDENQNLVRTFQNRDCSPSALFRSTSGYKPVYQYCADWDRKDDSGNLVPKGKYTAVARYYILYCPVLKVYFELK